MAPASLMAARRQIGTKLEPLACGRHPVGSPHSRADGFSCADARKRWTNAPRLSAYCLSVTKHRGHGRHCATAWALHSLPGIGGRGMLMRISRRRLGALGLGALPVLLGARAKAAEP